MFSRELNAKLGEILVEKGIISREQLNMALKEQKYRGIDQKKIGAYLVDLGFATEDDVTQALAVQFNMPILRLEGVKIKPEVLDLVSDIMAKKFMIMPVFRIDQELTLAISDPTDIHILDIISSESGCRVIPVIAPYSDISKSIDKYYLKKIESPGMDVVRETEQTEISRAEIEELKRAGVDLPIVKTVDRLLIEAVEDGVSDIHIEPREKELVVRFRSDGIMHEFSTYPIAMHPAVISRIKILSSMDISERQKPQDGRIQIRIDEKEIDIRVSTLPTHLGEKAVMRLLNRASVRVKIEHLGFSEKNLSVFENMIREPYGIVLVTGPTGSGKTTTLYAALNAVSSVERNIITVEDPVEYQLPLINQVQVNLKKDLTFANALRSILRQDPDIIMIGEIRDPETASIAAESALTGHLVFSTLHTNDAPSSITRLIDMGVEPFLLAPSVIGIIAQRLLRTICANCREEYVPSGNELSAIGLNPSMEGLVFSRGTGCEKCKGSGYKGRTGIHEILMVDHDIRELITNRASVGVIRDEAAKKGFRDMRFDGIRKVISGVTTIEELLRVTRNNR
ncbi:MAG: Flp pilus assembly complex ATPase component TadA [Nitrospirae bacterium]|nr:Flp pilus assembly complex ATPase component TadA [Nitrospirota bacterium]